MRKMIMALAAVGVACAISAPASADCITGLEEARMIISKMPDGRAKQRAMRELQLAEEAAANGDEQACVVHVGVCAQFTQR